VYQSQRWQIILSDWVMIVALVGSYPAKEIIRHKPVNVSASFEEPPIIPSPL
jgi:hypothetical protein